MNDGKGFHFAEHFESSVLPVLDELDDDGANYFPWELPGQFTRNSSTGGNNQPTPETT
jgi:hypothetical protein